MTIKAGDVVIYSSGRGEAIVDYVDIADSRAALVAWRDIGHPNNWIGSRGSGRLDVFTLTLHPQPDRVLAEYTAWRLTQ